MKQDLIYFSCFIAVFAFCSLQIVEKITGLGMSLSEDFLTEVKKKLQVLDQKDTDRKRTAELKNNLEGYIYTTKEKVRRKQYAYSFHFVNSLHLLCNG